MCKSSIALCLGAACIASAANVPARSFRQPFTTLSAAGARTVPSWTTGGDAAIHKGFVRLTTDRQSKRGFMWNRRALGSDGFTTQMQFRISGQGARWYGDGLGLWLTADGSYNPGLVHGVAEAFSGVGVVVDTFKNTESAELHKDVMILVNPDGTRTRAQMQALSLGCNLAGLRHHEKRADFSPASATARLRLTYDAADATLRVAVDATSSGEWTECAAVPLLEHGLDRGWARNSHLGITASTGQLADNHDVLALSSYDRVDDAEAAAEDARYRLARAPLAEQHGEDQVAILRSQLETLHTELEHQLSAMHEALQNSIRKLREQEEAAEARIAVLEGKLAGRIEAHVEARVERVTAQVRQNISSSVSQQIYHVQSAIDSTVSAHLARGAAQSGGWKLPFVALLLMFGGAGFTVTKKYSEYKKSHLL